jgi:hypothetical protein
MTQSTPHRIVIHNKVNEFETEIDFGHVLSDGFGIPSVVIDCPLQSKFEKHKGCDEYGEKIRGINFDDCMECSCFGGLGFGQEIYCFFKAQNRESQ